MLRVVVEGPGPDRFAQHCDAVGHQSYRHEHHGIAARPGQHRRAAREHDADGPSVGRRAALFPQEDRDRLEPWHFRVSGRVADVETKIRVGPQEGRDLRANQRRVDGVEVMMAWRS